MTRIPHHCASWPCQFCERTEFRWPPTPMPSPSNARTERQRRQDEQQQRREEFDRLIREVGITGGERAVPGIIALHRILDTVRYSAFCMSWVTIAWAMLVGREETA